MMKCGGRESQTNESEKYVTAAARIHTNCANSTIIIISNNNSNNEQTHNFASVPTHTHTHQRRNGKFMETFSQQHLEWSWNEQMKKQKSAFHRSPHSDIHNGPGWRGRATEQRNGPNENAKRDWLHTDTHIGKTRKHKIKSICQPLAVLHFDTTLLVRMHALPSSSIASVSSLPNPADNKWEKYNVYTHAHIHTVCTSQTDNGTAIRENHQFAMKWWKS